MELSAYIKASLLNLSFLACGIVIGLVFVPRMETTVYAQIKPPTPAQSSSTPTSSSTMPLGATVETLANGQKLISFTPVVQAGSIGVYLILSHHIQTDELVINGYDILKLQNAELELLSRVVPKEAIQRAVAAAAPQELYQARQQNPTTVQQQQK